MAGNDPLICDEEGYVYRHTWSGDWVRKEGFFGAARHTGFFGRPRLARTGWGDKPIPAKNEHGQPLKSKDGKPLFYGE